MTWLKSIQNTFGTSGFRNITGDELCSALKDTDQNYVRRWFKGISTREGSETASVPLQVLMIKIRVYLSKSNVEKCSFILEVLDHDGTGLIDEETFKRVLLVWMSSEGVTGCKEETAAATARSIFSKVLGNSQDKVITIEELLVCLRANQNLLETFESRFRSGEEVRRHSRERVPSSRCRPPCSRRYFTVAYVLHNQRKIYSVLIILLLSLLGFLWNAWRYIEHGQLIAVARGCGMALDVNCGLILIFTLRHFATHLRTTRFSKYLPLDHLVFLHKAVALLIGLFGAIHTVCHLVNVGSKCSSDCEPTDLLRLFLIADGEWKGLYTTTTAFLTGWAMVIIFIIMSITSYSYIRKHFHKAFQTAHFLAIPFCLFFLFHGKNDWKWLLIPGLLFLLEKVLSSRIVKRHRYGDTYVQSAHILPNGVVHLIIERPKKFKFQPGDYIFMQIPELSNHEWHPFTISSAPENLDHISLHVRTLGDWTQRLHDYFQRSQNRRRSICESFSPTKKPTKKLPNIGEDSDDDDDDGELRPPLTKLSKDSLHRRVQFRTPEKEPNTPETKPRMTFPNKKRGNFPMEAIRLSVSENIPSCSPVDRNSNSVRRNPADVQIDIAPQTRKTLRSHLSTQTSINIEDGCINVISTTDEDTQQLQVYVDGPYGTCTRRIFEADHVVMIAGGIGITPFASVLQSIMYRFDRISLNCPNCSHSWTENRPKATMKLKKVHFIWINRDRKNFEWFASLLTELDTAGQHYMGFDQFLDMQLFLTSEPDKQLLQDLALQLALDRASNKDSSELLAKLNENTRYGRPDWDVIFQRISQQRKGKVKVFFCGPPKMVKILKQMCEKYHFLFRRELF